MYDLHTHTIFSDGVLVPSELIRRAQMKGLAGIALTDHADASNLDYIVPRIVEVCRENNRERSIRAIPGVEITHAPPAQIPGLIEKARDLGARIVVVHGESPVEPVEEGTNKAAIEGRCDILAHPGLIPLELAQLASVNGVTLELTARKGHSLANGHVVQMAAKSGALLALNTESHTPGDLITSDFAKVVARGAGLSEDSYQALKSNMVRLAALGVD